jgi:O-antigen ligase
MAIWIGEMLVSLARASARTRMNIVLIGIFLSTVLLFGGASRLDVRSQPVVQLASIVTLVLALLQIDREEWRRVRLPALLFIAIAAIIAVQLLPLPSSLWSILPGRMHYLEAFHAAGVPPVWRPISLAPDLTINSLLATLPPLAVIAALAVIDWPLHRFILPLIIIGVVVSACVGLMQIAGGGPYFYRITNIGTGVGVFANRNHQAVFIACSLPMLSAWAAIPHADPAYRRLKFWLCLCVAAAMFPILLITGSRAGLLLGIVGAVVAACLPLNMRGKFKAAGSAGGRRLITFIPLAIGIVAIGAVVFFSRDTALRRLLEPTVMEKRSEFLPIYWQMVHDYFPFGAGYGSFDAVFRSYEPAGALSTEYMNQAHNDLIQIFIEGGLLAAVLLAVFFLWFGQRSACLWVRKAESVQNLLGRAGSAIVLLIFLSSIVEYPLRTPLMAVLFAIACCWLLPEPLTVAATSEHKDRVGSDAVLE